MRPYCHLRIFKIMIMWPKFWTWEDLINVAQWQLFCNNVMCGNCSSAFDNFTIFTPAINARPSSASLQSCMKDVFFLIRLNERDNLYLCGICNKLGSPPNALVIQMKRFSATGDAKINTKIDVPLTFDLSAFSMTPDEPQLSTKPSKRAHSISMYALRVLIGFH